MTKTAVVYTAFAEFEVNNQVYKSGDVFPLPANWVEAQESLNNNPGNPGIKFTVPGELLYDEKGKQTDQQFRQMILPVNKS